MTDNLTGVVLRWSCFDGQQCCLEKLLSHGCPIQAIVFAFGADDGRGC
jgi:hypothetical protein